MAGRIGLPSSYLFAAMLVGLAFALGRPALLPPPQRAFRLAQATVGVVLGVFLQSSTFSSLGTRWIAVALVSVATLGVSLAGGVLLGRLTSLEPTTASLGMIAGGASGIVGMADEIGGDDRLVAFMQYLRVLTITLLTPVLVPLAFGAHGHGVATGGSELGNLGGWALLAGAGTLGALAARPLHVPAPTLLGPLILTAALSFAGVLSGVRIPLLARDVAFAVIGIRIGLGFQRQILAQMARLLPAVLLAIAGLMITCLGLGWVLSLTTGVSLLDGYLATTPGGLYAVLPIAYGSGASTTFVLTVQGLRLLAMMLLAPLIVRRLTRPRPPQPTAAGASAYRPGAGAAR